MDDLAVSVTAGPSRHTNSPHPSSREGHLSTARWSSSFLLLYLILHGTHATAVSRVHRNSVPSTQMRCIITASRRARATIAFSNRPFGVKHFQTIHHHSVDVARGLGLLFGISTTALPSWVSRTRWNNVKSGLAIRCTVGAGRLTDSSHPSSREGHLSTARWSSSFLLSYLILDGHHATANSRVQRNSVRAVHDHGQPTRQRHDRLLHPAVPGDLHRPGLEPGPFWRAHQ